MNWRGAMHLALKRQGGRCAPNARQKNEVKPASKRPRDVDQCYRNCGPINPPTAVGGCLTDSTPNLALPMPYNGGRAALASRAPLPDGRRSWRLREMAPAKLSEQENKAPQCHCRLITKPKNISLQLFAPEIPQYGASQLSAPPRVPGCAAPSICHYLLRLFATFNTTCTNRTPSE
jgi:hypothetical protein